MEFVANPHLNPNPSQNQDTKIVSLLGNHRKGELGSGVYPCFNGLPNTGCLVGKNGIKKRGSPFKFPVVKYGYQKTTKKESLAP